MIQCNFMTLYQISTYIDSSFFFLLYHIPNAHFFSIAFAFLFSLNGWEKKIRIFPTLLTMMKRNTIICSQKPFNYQKKRKKRKSLINFGYAIVWTCVQWHRHHQRSVSLNWRWFGQEKAIINLFARVDRQIMICVHSNRFDFPLCVKWHINTWQQ